MQSGILSEGDYLDHGSLGVRVRRAAALLAASGVRPGDTVALLLRNSVTAIEATLAAQHIGAYPVPVNWHFTAQEIAYVLQDCGARLLVAHADLLERLTDPLPGSMAVFTVGDGTSHPDWDGSVSASEPMPGDPHPVVASMIYTSGTSGRPKGVRRAAATPEQAATVARIRDRLYAPMAGMRTLITAPLYHTAPVLFASFTSRRDGLLVLETRFDAERTLQLIEQHRITHLYAVPTMFVRLLALPEAVRSRYDLSSLRWVLHAGAPCPPDVKKAMIDWWGPVISEYYGSTEMGPLTFCTAQEWLENPGSVGKPLPGVTIEIRDEAGRLCPAGVPGDVILVESGQPDFTYHGDDAKRRALATDHGLVTGDMGYLDEAGRLFICDRRTDMIISGGVNIYPAEIEAALIGYPGIEDCAVIGLPNAEYGEEVVAVVQAPALRDALPEADIQAFLRKAIAGYKVPRRIIAVDALPRDDSGKIFKRRLKEGLGPNGAKAI
ncbi:o-succinylbenzoate--CoA ligase [Sphingobium indicum]|uniref:O-succinylbenzoate--CoA ligase n=1 Tax=Sphingobium indicum TaxID=332055 RepID=A0A4Q4J6A0_9SPHN|nr:AMP-binding protein [Sphingobium indicum]RYM01531.1 o-succinylbenzoate--CoA ligase [Sphingobium indicum]